MKILVRYQMGDEVNAWLGLCWYDHYRREVVCAPIGLNVLIVLAVRARNWLAVEFPRKHALRRRVSAYVAKERLLEVIHADRTSVMSMEEAIQAAIRGVK